jgi:hypothetical protein
VLGGRYPCRTRSLSWYSRWNNSTQQQANARVIALDACGKVRISEVARLLGTGEHDARGSWPRWCSMTRSPAA